MQLLSSQFREDLRKPEHPQHPQLFEPDPDRRMKNLAFNPSWATVVHGCESEDESEKERKKNKKMIHTNEVQVHLASIRINPLINTKPPEINKNELKLPRVTRRILAQLRAQKCPLLKEYLHNIGKEDDPSCPLCGRDPHDTTHLFQCPEIPTGLTPIDLWRHPTEVASLLEEWQTALALAEED